MPDHNYLDRQVRDAIAECADQEADFARLAALSSSGDDENAAELLVDAAGALDDLARRLADMPGGELAGEWTQRLRDYGNELEEYGDWAGIAYYGLLDAWRSELAHR